VFDAPDLFAASIGAVFGGTLIWFFKVEIAAFFAKEIPVVEAGAATVVPDVKAEIAALEARFTALGTKISAVKAAIEK
jgi:hypothetical protein